ncbi:MAG: 4Fe-4S binding protein [Anaerolineales bacterium]|nr:4Fe-4S binding protein [Anaerolineales bacterium]
MPDRPRLVKASTRTFLREAKRLLDFSLFDSLHGYVYARWPYLYIGLGREKHPLNRILNPIISVASKIWPKRTPPANGSGTFADGYHGKVIPTETARQLVSIQEDIRIEDLEQVIPYPKARALILQNPEQIVALECPCRAAVENPCLPLDVCLIVGEPFASFVHQHHPDRSRKLSREQAIEILEAERERGHVHHAFFKDAMLGRFYAICNCCSCCCGAMNAHRNGIPMLAPSGYICQVDQDLCTGCGTCETVCPFTAISLDSGYSTIDYTACMGCGVCVEHCPERALTLTVDSKKGIPLELGRLLNQTETFDRRL